MRARAGGRAGFVVLVCSACGSSGAPVRTAPPPAATADPPVMVTEAAASSTPAPAAPSSAQQTAETAAIATMLRHVQQVRQLDATRPVPGVRLGRGALIERVKEHVARELPPKAIRNEGLELQLFGFLPTGFDYEAAEYQLLQEQLAGYYEPADRTMYLASDLHDDEADATLAHELVHALQDQHWDLESRSRYRPGEGDRSEAVSALAEGDATSAMYDMIVPRVLGAGATALDVPDIAAQIREGVSQGPGAKAPSVMRSSLAAPYIYGTLFVNALRRKGGWAAVDRAWEDPPTTSEQVLHVDKWLAHEPAKAVSAPTIAALGPGWEIIDEDSEGELGARTAFEEWVPLAEAAEVSAGWGGDRGVLVANGDRAAFGWRMRYDDGARAGGGPAAHAYAVLAHALDRVLGPATAKGPDAVCRERADRGPIAIAHKGLDLVVTLGPARVTPSAWSTAADCAAALKWIREIAAAP